MCDISKKLQHLKVLIVEDERIVALDIQRKLEKLGYTVVGNVSCGKDAINRADEKKPDLLLMDIKLDGSIDGIETTRRIHTKSDVPVIYLTAYTDAKTVERARETNPLGYLSKPFEDYELKTIIDNTFPKK